MTSDFSHFKILCQEKKIDLKMCACDSDLKSVAFLLACHLLYSHCNRFRIKFVHKFGLLILLRGMNPVLDWKPEMGTYNISRILHSLLHVHYYEYYVLSFLHYVFFMWWEVNYLKCVCYFVYKTMYFT